MLWNWIWIRSSNIRYENLRNIDVNCKYISGKNARIYSIIWPPTMVRNSDPTQLYTLFHTYKIYRYGHLNLVPPWCVTLEMQLNSNLFDPPLKKLLVLFPHPPLTYHVHGNLKSLDQFVSTTAIMSLQQ